MGLHVPLTRLTAEAADIPADSWQKVYLPIPKRKYKHVTAHESKVSFLPGAKELRQIIIKDHGRSEPTFIITNNRRMKLEEALTVYARRWHIENKLSELVKFFSLNALSSPIMTRIHFDVLWTVIADTLYRLLARDLPMFEKAEAPEMFRRFIDMPGQVHYDGKGFNIRIRKRATTPVLMGVEKLKSDINVPWLENRPVRIIWTP